MRMKLSVLKQLIKEEFLREIKVDTRRAKLVKVGNNWELAVGDYITMSYEASFNMPAGYKLMPAVLPRLFQEGNNIHLLVYYDLDNEEAFNYLSPKQIGSKSVFDYLLCLGIFIKLRI
jgi:hypothetical protein